MPELTFSRLSETNGRRTERWHGPEWREPADPWTLADWANAMGGEAGEACNIVKELRRWQTGLGAGPGCYPGCTYDQMMPQMVERAMDEGKPLEGTVVVRELFDALAGELADVVLYADLLATKAGIDLGEAVRAKFNSKSAEQGFPERL